MAAMDYFDSNRTNTVIYLQNATLPCLH